MAISTTSVSSVIIHTFISSAVTAVTVSIATVAMVIQSVFVAVTSMTPVTSVMTGSQLQVLLLLLLLVFASHRCHYDSDHQKNLQTIKQLDKATLDTAIYVPVLTFNAIIF